MGFFDDYLKNMGGDMARRDKNDPHNCNHCAMYESGICRASGCHTNGDEHCKFGWGFKEKKTL